MRVKRKEKAETVGYMAVYIDDLITGDETVIAAALKKLREVWETSEPEWLTKEDDLRFCGFELGREEKGVRLHQESYTADAESVKAAQVITGEFVWLLEMWHMQWRS